MTQTLDFMKNIISPRKEMFAYETLWAMKDIKEKTLKEMFKQYTPSETLGKLFNQSGQRELFVSEQSFNKIQDEVNKFLEDSLWSKRLTFSIMVNKSIQYPKSLKYDYPIGLFYYKGNLDILDTKCISIVGARKASSKGILRAKQLVKELTAESFTIVSGLAQGIDTAAHQSAIENKGLTIEVIGTPINKYYPKENKKLQDEIAKDFLLISQVPFYRYAHEPFKYRAYHFPRRNMIMASISNATVIVEASDISGSLIQARECLKQNKKLFILESCFKNREIKWPHIFEKKGAIKVKNTSDILNHINGNLT